MKREKKNLDFIVVKSYHIISYHFIIFIKTLHCIKLKHNIFEIHI